MGSLINNRINPKTNHQSQKQHSKSYQVEVSRRNFKIISKISTTGHNQQSVMWLAQYWQDPTQKFFVKKTSKQLASRNGRVESIKNQLAILIREKDNSFMMKPLWAFQDYSSLYLVHKYVEGFTLEEVLKEHIFTEDEAKYVIIGLINIIERLHQQKFALTELSPKNILINKKTGQMKLLQLVNPLPIDSYYPSSMIIPLNPNAAPEILMMDRVLAESDYYSLGLILYYIMKNKPAIPPQINQDRMAIINENIEVVKSDLPQGWKPEAADFLVKLLIKNPSLRLGRYGSFEVRNHPWLQNFTWSQSYTISNINLVQNYFKSKKYQTIKKQLNSSYKEDINYSYEFQIQFENYEYGIEQENQETDSHDSIKQQF